MLKQTLKPEHTRITQDDFSVMETLFPMLNHVIIRVIENNPRTESGIITNVKAAEKSTLGMVLLPNTVSFNRDGTRANPVLKVGDLVRLQRGNVGTDIPEAPDGQKWLAVPEDVIYYYRRFDKKHEGVDNG